MKRVIRNEGWISEGMALIGIYSGVSSNVPIHPLQDFMSAAEEIDFGDFYLR
jgi:hypothetical protein